MRLMRKREKGLSDGMKMLLAGLGLFGVYLFTRELPALRRYLRIERM